MCKVHVLILNIYKVINMKIYTSKQLNEIIGYVDKSGSNSDKKSIITRCCNAGLIVEALDTPRGKPNQFIIIKDNFHLDGEEWVDCYCNNKWEVSNLGRIRRKSTKKLMGSIDCVNGYVRVSMIENGKSSNKQLNRLIYFSFHPDLIEYSNNIQIDHINGIRNDNRLENLQPLTSIQNTQKRDDNQNKIKTLTTQLILKFGYEDLEKKLKKLLTEE